MVFRRGTGPRLVALLLAVVVSADITLGAACDPIDLPASAPGATAVSAGGSAPVDACTSFCVPDCFCCSRSETAGPALTLPDLSAIARAISPVPASVPSIARPVPEPPPLAFS